MIFKDLSGFTTRFYFDNEDQSAWVELRLIPDEEREAAVDENLDKGVDYQVNPKTNKLERLEYSNLDFKALKEWSVVNGIAAWGGLYLEDAKGVKTELPCTDENKWNLYRTQKAFKEFVDKKFDELVKIATQEFGSSSTEKNSESTQGIG